MNLLQIFSAVGFVVSAAALTQPAQADSDGHYCATASYLAWETRGFRGDGTHQLHVIPLAAPTVRWHVELPDFQLHGLQCGDSSVQIYAFTDAHRIDIEAHSASYVGAEQPTEIDSLRERWLPRRFGDTPELSLRGAPPGTELSLVTDLARRKFAESSEFTTLVRLIQTDKQRRLIDSQVIFAEAIAEAIAD